MSEPIELRSIKEIIADLSKPVAMRHLSKKKQGGKDIYYLSWHDAARYMDLFAPGWCYEIMSMQAIAGKLIIVTRVTIPSAEGLVYREATGQEDETKDSWGDSSSNAESMSLRRACAKFGLGLYLYDENGWKKSLNAQTDKPKEDAPEAVRTQQTAHTQAETQTENIEFPANPIAKSLSELVTAKQLGMVRAIARELGIDADEECQSVMQCRSDELSKKAASVLIEHLQMLQKSRTEIPPYTQAPDAKTAQTVKDEKAEVVDRATLDQLIALCENPPKRKTPCDKNEVAKHISKNRTALLEDLTQSEAMAAIKTIENLTERKEEPVKAKK